MSIIPESPAKVIIPAEALQLNNHHRAVLLAARLVVESGITPDSIHVTCYHFRPTTVHVQLSVHHDQPKVRAWHDRFGGELTRTVQGSGSIHWAASTEIDGIPVELYTLLTVVEDDAL